MKRCCAVAALVASLVGCAKDVAQSTPSAKPVYSVSTTYGNFVLERVFMRTKFGYDWYLPDGSSAGTPKDAPAIQALTGPDPFGKPLLPPIGDWCLYVQFPKGFPRTGSAQYLQAGKSVHSMSFIAPGDLKEEHSTDLYVVIAQTARPGDFQILLPGRSKEVVATGAWPFSSPVKIEGVGELTMERRDVERQSYSFSLKYDQPEKDQFYELVVFLKGNRLTVYDSGNVIDQATGKVSQPYWRVEGVAPTARGTFEVRSLDVVKLDFKGVVLKR